MAKKETIVARHRWHPIVIEESTINSRRPFATGFAKAIDIGGSTTELTSYGFYVDFESFLVGVYAKLS